MIETLEQLRAATDRTPWQERVWHAYLRDDVTFERAEQLLRLGPNGPAPSWYLYYPKKTPKRPPAERKKTGERSRRPDPGPRARAYRQALAKSG